MTLTYSCSSCGKALYGDANVVSNRIRGSSIIGRREIFVEVMAGEGKSPNNGELCKDCVLKAVKELAESKFR